MGIHEIKSVFHFMYFTFSNYLVTLMKRKKIFVILFIYFCKEFRPSAADVLNCFWDNVFCQSVWFCGVPNKPKHSEPLLFDAST